MIKKVGVLGSGAVGQTLANAFKDLDYDVAVGRRSEGKVDNWNGDVGTFADVAKNSELIVLAVKGSAAEDIVRDLKNQLKGKIVIDTTNPIDSKPPEDGVLRYFTNLDDSLMERLQVAAPDSKLVKAFNIVGSQFMVNPDFDGTKPTMFICGNDQNAKSEVSDILHKLGWEIEDMGGVKSARAIEPLCMLWCIPGMISGQWSHAFKLLKK